MILSTADIIGGKKTVKVLGIVRGNSIRARHIGHDIAAGIKGLIGGEIHDYTKLMAESREQAIDRMIDAAQSLGANAIIAVRLTTSSVMQGAAELLAYGTAVIVE